MKGYMSKVMRLLATFPGEGEMLDKNEDLRYVVPSEGSNLVWYSKVIPKTVKHEKGYAYQLHA